MNTRSKPFRIRMTKVRAIEIENAAMKARKVGRYTLKGEGEAMSPRVENLKTYQDLND